MQQQQQQQQQLDVAAAVSSLNRAVDDLLVSPGVLKGR
jgi:hypothetical protein